MSNTIKLVESIQNNLNEFDDNSKYYFILNKDTGYLLQIEKIKGYYDNDPASWIVDDAKSINDAKKFRKYDTALKMKHKGEDNSYNPTLYYEDKPFDDLENLKVVSLNQLLKGEITTKTDLSSINQSNTDTNIDTDEFNSNEVEYTFTTEDGERFSCTVEFEDEPNFEEMPAFIEAVQYSEDKGFNKIKSMYGDVEITWIKDEDNNWVEQLD